MFALLPLFISTAGIQGTRELKPSDLASLAWRSVGPANMGGRVADINIAPSDSKTFFVAFGCSGLWKTTNNGTTFKPVFDSEATSAIGAVVVADAPESWAGWADDKTVTNKLEAGKSKIVWVGTGEGNGRNSSSWGNGVYRSIDGGSTWKHLGLADSREIPRLAVDPKNPDVCYVAALGHLWGPNKTRGIYKTTDGGKTWANSLQIDENTGACWVQLDPTNAQTVYAAMYSRRRTAYSYQSGGSEGGIYKSLDGGKSWKKLTRGLPKQTGRIGIDVSQSKPNVLMAVVESDEGGSQNIDENRSRAGGVFRSEDGGENWVRVNAQNPRPFYFSKIKIDPKNDQRIYQLGWNIWTSDDAGHTFKEGFTPKLHVDWHAMMIDPKDPDRLLVGSDGGLYQSFDRGATWDFVNQLAVGQFYNLAVDDSKPYRIAGGLQDNGSWLGKGYSFEQDERGTAITNQDWSVIGGGDGFHVGFDLTNPNIFYSESQGGSLVRIHADTRFSKGLAPTPKEGQPAFRFNWNSPFFVSPHDQTVIYLGGNKVFKLTARGDKWKEISPDLTTNNPLKAQTTGSSAEAHCTVVALAESKKKKGTLWAGTDDGLIHVTENDGGAWANVTPREVDGWYVAMIDASPHDAKTAFAAIDGHRSDHYDPLVLMTRDLGKSWHNISANLPKEASVRSIREDLKSAGVLYCGTENGIYLSIDTGKSWVKFNTGSLPTVGVHDIAQQTREMDLVVATHGRSVWVLDDMAAVSQLTHALIQKKLAAFKPRDARPELMGFIDGLWGDKYFGAPNKPQGVAIQYWLRDATDAASIEIKNAKGEVIASLTGGGKAGINKVHWDFKMKPDLSLPNRGEEPSLVFAPAGRYTISISAAGETGATSLTILPHDLGNATIKGQNRAPRGK